MRAGEWADPQTHACLRIVDRIAEHRKAELAVKSVFPKAQLAAAFHGSPFTHKLYDGHRNLEVVTDQMRQANGWSLLKAEKAGVERERLRQVTGIGLHTGRTETGQIIQMRVNAIFFLSLRGESWAMALPGSVKKRKDAMMEEIEKIPKSGIARAGPIGGKGRVGVRQNPLGAREAEKTHTDAHGLIRTVFGRHRDPGDFAGGERQRRWDRQPQDFGRRVGPPANGRAFGL